MQNKALRIARHSDIPALVEVFELSIRMVATSDYSKAQIDEWLKTKTDHQRWDELVQKQTVLLIESGNKVVGFGSLKDKNYIDFLYVHGQFQRLGIAQTILDALLTEAKSADEQVITSDVSYTARPFFEKNGFVVVKQNDNIRGNEVLVNFKMQLDLTTA